MHAQSKEICIWHDRKMVKLINSQETRRNQYEKDKQFHKFWQTMKNSSKKEVYNDLLTLANMFKPTLVIFKMEI